MTRACALFVWVGACASSSPADRTESEPPPHVGERSEPTPTAREPARGCRAPTDEERPFVEAAERFVRDNGYTLAAVGHDVELSAEGIEPGTDRASRLEFRRGSLEPAAFAIFAAHQGAPARSVVFRYTLEYLRRNRSESQAVADHARLGRAVEQGATSARIIHQDALLDHVVRLCPAATPSAAPVEN